MLKGSKVALVADIPIEAREWRNNVEIWQWCRQYTLIDELAQHRWIEKISLDPTIKMFGIQRLEVSKTHGDLINRFPLGVCGLTSIDRVNQKAEFSLYIAEEYQNQGFGKDALKTLLKHGFLDHNLNMIYGECFEGNPALEMFKSLGMKEDGILRASYFRGGKFINSTIVSILRSEFNV